MPGAVELGAQVRICAPNILALSKENVDFVHPIFGPYKMYCAPNLRLLPLPLNPKYISHDLLKDFSAIKV